MSKRKERWRTYIFSMRRRRLASFRASRSNSSSVYFGGRPGLLLGAAGAACGCRVTALGTRYVGAVSAPATPTGGAMPHVGQGAAGEAAGASEDGTDASRVGTTRAPVGASNDGTGASGAGWKVLRATFSDRQKKTF
jgi:hypothetical protein